MFVIESRCWIRSFASRLHSNPRTKGELVTKTLAYPQHHILFSARFEVRTRGAKLPAPDVSRDPISQSMKVRVISDLLLSWCAPPPPPPRQSFDYSITAVFSSFAMRKAWERESHHRRSEREKVEIRANVSSKRWLPLMRLSCSAHDHLS